MWWMVWGLDLTLPAFTLLDGCSDILRWEYLEELGLMNRWRKVDIQCPLAAGEAGKRSDLNLRYIFFFCPPVCQWPRTWALFWYSYCLASLSNFSPFGFSFIIYNVMKITIKEAVLGNCLITGQPFLCGDSSLSKVSLSCWLGVCVYREGPVSKYTSKSFLGGQRQSLNHHLSSHAVLMLYSPLLN